MKPETVSDTTEFNQIIVDISSTNCMPNTIGNVFITYITEKALQI